MAALCVLCRVGVLLALAACASGQAQAQAAHASVSVAFANDLGDGPFRAALLRGLRQQFATLRLQLAEDPADLPQDRRYAGVLRVRSLAERVNAAGQPTIEATVSLSLVDPATGAAWLARVIRADYPETGSSPLETLGEASGRRVAAAICEVACGPRPLVRAPQVRTVRPPRRIIKESDW